MTDKVLCTKCGSSQLTAHKQGFSGKKAVGGAILTGGIGLLAGTIGSNKILITCLSCGNTFRPGQNTAKQPRVASKSEFKIATFLAYAVAILSALFTFGGLLVLFGSILNNGDDLGSMSLTTIFFGVVTFIFFKLGRKSQRMGSNR